MHLFLSRLIVMALVAGVAGSVTATGTQAEVAQVSVTADMPAADGPFPWPQRVSLSEPTDRYPHNVLGDIPAFTRMDVDLQMCRRCAQPQRRISLTLPPPWVFEDVAPRLWDVTGDGRPEIVVVQSHATHGARLTVWSMPAMGDDSAPLVRMIAATPPIGRRFRWLAPVGFGDFTGDGQTELAYVETPHLGKTLRIVGLQGAQLVPRAAISGVTNHRIGENTITGFVRHCAGRTEAVVASADWTRMLAVSYQSGALVSRDLGPVTDQQGWDRARRCAG